MKKKYFYNLITLLLVTSFILTPFSPIFAPKAEAQAGLSGYVSGLIPTIVQLPLCKGKLMGAAKSLFGPLASVLGSAAQKGLQALNTGLKLANNLKDAKSQINNIPTYDSAANRRIATMDVAIRVQLEQIKKSTTSIDENDSCIKSIGRMVIKLFLQKITVSTVAWINSGFNGKPSFIQNPSKFFEDIAKNELLGFGLELEGIGNPFSKAWLRNTAAAFQNRFAQNAAYSLDQVLLDSDSTVASFQANFAQGGWNAWTALTQRPANNPLGFRLMADQEINARLSGTSQSNAQNTRDALQTASGFLGDERCADPTGITRQQHNAALRAGVRDPGTNTIVGLCKRWEYVTPGKLISEMATSAIKFPENNLLKAEDLNDAIAAILDALLNKFTSDLMQKGFASMGTEGADGSPLYGSFAPTDYSTQTERDFSSSNLSSSWLSANEDFNIRTDLSQALVDEQRTYADKLALQNKELNSTYDGQPYEEPFITWTYCAEEGGTCTLPGANPRQVRFGVPGAYKYAIPVSGIVGSKPCTLGAFGLPDPAPGMEKSCEYSSMITDVTTNGISNAYGLIPAIAQLDYCIPGPHPGFEEDSQLALDAIVNIIPASMSKNMLTLSTSTTNFSDLFSTFGYKANQVANSAIGMPLAIPQADSIVTVSRATMWGMLVEALTHHGWWNVTWSLQEPIITKLYYFIHFYSLTWIPSYWLAQEGTTTQTAQLTPAFEEKEGLETVLRMILDRYINLSHKVYNSKILPGIYKEAASEFNKLKGYVQMMANNEEKIAEVKNAVYMLGEIKLAVDKLNRDLVGGVIEPADYESSLKPQINAFGRLTANMVSGEDIADIDNQTKQIIDEKNFVYKDLLKGPFGCEKDLEGRKQNMPTWLYATQRPNYYPYPIIYTYDRGGNIPDKIPDSPGTTPAWESGYINTLNANAILDGLTQSLCLNGAADPANCGTTPNNLIPIGTPGVNSTAVKGYYTLKGLCLNGATNAPACTTFPPLGPGFLSFYQFQTNPWSAAYNNCVANTEGAVPFCELRLDDLVPLYKPELDWFMLRSLGKIPESSYPVSHKTAAWIVTQRAAENTYIPLSTFSSPFESMIGVY